MDFLNALNLYKFKKTKSKNELHDPLDQIQEISKISSWDNVIEQQALGNKFIEESMITSVTDHLPIGIWSMDKRKNQIVFCSRGVEDIYGIAASRFKEDPYLLMEFVHPEDRLTVEEKNRKLLHGEDLIHQYRIIDRHGSEKWISDHTLPYFDEEGNLISIHGIIQDITKEKKYTEALAFIANRDYLTKLPNRNYFEKQLNKHILESKKDGKQFAVLHIDLDRLKQINDSLGHQMGDQLLIATANRLKHILGLNALLARIGGDEFASCIEDFSKVEEILPVAQKIIKKMESPFYIDDYELVTTVSIGISLFPFNGEDSITLLKNADQAVKKVKELGRNDWQIYSPSLNIESFTSFQLERGLRRAVMNNEFFLEYQPKVNTKTGRIEGAEALIRWKHPDWGIVSPGEFIPLAEESGFILKMGDWVLQEVCELQGKWQKEGIPMVPISVNISPKRLLRADFVRAVQETINAAGVDPSLIEFELTEYVILQNTETTKKVISELKELGVKVALDDFGTGYSSLSYLMELDIDTLKIDKSFIDGIGVNKKNEGIIKGTLFLAKELDMQVVAEGVEGKEQLSFLLQQECSQIQGYIFSRPVKESDFKKLLIKKTMKATPTISMKSPIKNRREYYRLHFKSPLCADLTVIKFKNRDIELGKSKSLIKDISLGGLNYLSNIDLPIQADLVLQFTTVILGKQVQFVGKNVWKSEVDGLFHYGFEFIMSERERMQFSPIFNQLSLQLKSNPLLPGCNFLKGNKRTYFER